MARTLTAVLAIIAVVAVAGSSSPPAARAQIAPQAVTPPLPDCDRLTADHHADALVGPGRYSSAMEDTAAQARTGDTQAMYDLGMLYQYPEPLLYECGGGDSIPPDGAKAARWYLAAARGGNTPAMTALASLYLGGFGIPRDRAKALRWLRHAIRLGEPSAMHDLGGMMLTGEGVPRDPIAALKLLRKAAVKGYPDWGAASPPPMVSGVTHRREHIGQCFETRVRKVSGRLGPYYPDGNNNSGSAIVLADGHYNVDYAQLPGIDRSRRGDPVRLCVTAMPTNCPTRRDTRGIQYRGLNLRTGLSWEAFDSEHLCGGA